MCNLFLYNIIINIFFFFNFFHVKGVIRKKLVLIKEAQHTEIEFIFEIFCYLSQVTNYLNEMKINKNCFDIFKNIKAVIIYYTVLLNIKNNT